MIEGGAGRVARNGYGRPREPRESKRTAMLFFRVSLECKKAIAARSKGNQSAWLRKVVEAALQSS